MIELSLHHSNKLNYGYYSRDYQMGHLTMRILYLYHDPELLVLRYFRIYSLFEYPQNE